MQELRRLARIDQLNSLLALAHEIAENEPPEPKPTKRNLPSLEEMRTAGIELGNKLRRVCARRGLMVPEFWT